MAPVAKNLLADDNCKNTDPKHSSPQGLLLYFCPSTLLGGSQPIGFLGKRFIQPFQFRIKTILAWHQNVRQNAMTCLCLLQCSLSFYSIPLTALTGTPRGPNWPLFSIWSTALCRAVRTLWREVGIRLQLCEGIKWSHQMIPWCDTTCI